MLCRGVLSIFSSLSLFKQLLLKEVYKVSHKWCFFLFCLCKCEGSHFPTGAPGDSFILHLIASQRGTGIRTRTRLPAAVPQRTAGRRRHSSRSALLLIKPFFLMTFHEKGDQQVTGGCTQLALQRNSVCAARKRDAQEICMWCSAIALWLMTCCPRIVVCQISRLKRFV